MTKTNGMIEEFIAILEQLESRHEITLTDAQSFEVACKIQRNRIEQDKLNAFREAFVLGHNVPGVLEKAIMILDDKIQ